MKEQMELLRIVERWSGWVVTPDQCSSALTKQMATILELLGRKRWQYKVSAVAIQYLIQVTGRMEAYEHVSVLWQSLV